MQKYPVRHRAIPLLKADPKVNHSRSCSKALQGSSLFKSLENGCIYPRSLCDQFGPNSSFPLLVIIYSLSWLLFNKQSNTAPYHSCVSKQCMHSAQSRGPDTQFHSQPIVTHYVSLPSCGHFRVDKSSLGACFLNFQDGQVKYKERKTISPGHPA